MKDKFYIKLVDRSGSIVWEHPISFIPNIKMGEFINIEALSESGIREVPNEYKRCKVLKIEHEFECWNGDINYHINLLVEVTDKSE